MRMRLTEKPKRSGGGKRGRTRVVISGKMEQEREKRPRCIDLCEPSQRGGFTRYDFVSQVDLKDCRT
ncbi:hypothetical protein PsorP6_001895 [Peronosclerospora sorghi]|uniref:Uncharacterized protein n=1 Tax=Peronosclerospora sorghi TaxID=230839 RepID=A0ACC0WVI2_9STRA|nr:hypothetical protein PsorP6_001895 [Peronosclerospora sorghi]